MSHSRTSCRNTPPNCTDSSELRLYLGAPQQPAFTVKYAAANIQVIGDTWHLVGPPAAASCLSGKAVSLEAILPAVANAPTPTAGAHATAPAPAATASAATAGATPPRVAAGLAADDQAPRSSAESGTDPATVVLIIGLAIAAAGAVGWWLLMRRRARSVS